MKFIVEKILKFLTKRYLAKYKPKIIAITGSNGKTSAKEAIFTVLENKYRVRKSEQNYNTEIGVPLSVFGVSAPASNFLWPLTLLKICFKVYRDKNVPEILILEMGADKPGDLKYLTSFIKPDISVITAIGEFPVHVQYYSGPKGVAEEKSFLVKVLEANGVAILNYDDKMVLDMGKKTRGHIFTYGFEQGAIIKGEGISMALCDGDNKEDFCGTFFKVVTEGKIVPFKLENVYGKSAGYAALAAFAVGEVLGMNLVEIAKALEEYKAPKGRMNLIKAINGAYILDDSYNSSPLAASAALEVLKDIPSKRKIAVLGDMKELGKYSQEAHELIGKEAAKIAEYIFTVGEQAKIISKSAMENGFKKENIFEFDSSFEVGKILRKIISEDNLILVKGSQSMRMELVVEEIMAEPERKKDLLVRQYWPWKDKNGNPRML